MQALSATLLKKRSGCKCFPVIFAKFLRIFFKRTPLKTLTLIRLGFLGVFFFKLNKDFSKKDKDFIQKVCMNVSFASYRYYTTSIFFLCYSWLVLTSWIYISKRGVGGMLLWIKPFLYGAVTNVDSAHINVRRRCVIIFWMVKKLSVGWMER